jgi:hypothetical protein
MTSPTPASSKISQYQIESERRKSVARYFQIVSNPAEYGTSSPENWLRSWSVQELTTVMGQGIEVLMKQGYLKPFARTLEKVQNMIANIEERGSERTITILLRDISGQTEKRRINILSLREAVRACLLALPLSA